MPEPVTEPTPTPEPSPPPPAADPPVDVAAITRERDETKRALGRAEKDLEKLQKAAKQRDDADKSETEKLTAEVAELKQSIEQRETRARDAMVGASAVSAAARLGFADPDDAVRFLDRDALELDDDGRPTNVERLLTDVLKAKPYLKASTPTPADLGQGGRGRATLTLDQIRGKDPEWINDHWDEVTEALERSPAGR